MRKFETQGQKSMSPGILLGFILLLALFLRLQDFTGSLWFDEVDYSTHCIWLKDVTHLSREIKCNYPAPFYYIFMFGWIRLFGDAEWSVRLPPLIFGILSIVLAYVLAFKFLGRRTALLTAFLLCLSPVHIWYSREATPYSMCLFLFLLSVFSFYKSQEKTAGPIWVFVYFLTALSGAFSLFFLSGYIFM